jgi:glycosyltransferase involved in cell wall biosynthesis
MSVGFVKGMLPDLTKKYEVVLLSSPGPEMEDAKEKLGVRTIEVAMERHISLVKDLVALFKLIRIFKREKPDMVHSMTPKAGLLCMVAAWMTRVPVRIHTFTGLVWPTAKGLQRWILKMTDRITCSCATHIIPEGQGVLNDLKTGGITSKELKVLGYGNVRGIDMTRFSHRLEIIEKARQIRKNDVFTFLFVGRIVGDKGINELVEAFIRLHSEYNKVRLLLVGFFEENIDPILPVTKTQIENTPSIIAAGEQLGDDLIAHYAAADCFVFPSYREGFPNTVMEAGAMGLPCIVTDINGSREIITSNIDDDNSTVAIKANGIIVPSKNVEMLYEAMKFMITNKEKREAMAANARPMIEKRFEQGFVRKCLYDYYEEIL